VGPACTAYVPARSRLPSRPPGEFSAGSSAWSGHCSSQAAVGDGTPFIAVAATQRPGTNRTGGFSSMDSAQATAHPPGVCRDAASYFRLVANGSLPLFGVAASTINWLQTRGSLASASPRRHRLRRTSYGNWTRHHGRPVKQDEYRHYPAVRQRWPSIIIHQNAACALREASGSGITASAQAAVSAIFEADRQNIRLCETDQAVLPRGVSGCPPLRELVLCQLVPRRQAQQLIADSSDSTQCLVWCKHFVATGRPSPSRSSSGLAVRAPARKPYHHLPSQVRAT